MVTENRCMNIMQQINYSSQNPSHLNVAMALEASAVPARAMLVGDGWRQTLTQIAESSRKLNFRIRSRRRLFLQLAATSREQPRLINIIIMVSRAPSKSKTPLQSMIDILFKNFPEVTNCGWMRLLHLSDKGNRHLRSAHYTTTRIKFRNGFTNTNLAFTATTLDPMTKLILPIKNSYR